MGCGDSKHEPTLQEEYAASNLSQPLSAEYDNDFEKWVFQAINLCRFNPKSFIGPVKAAAEHPACANLKTKDLIEHLKTIEPRTLVTFDMQANQAVRENNAAVVLLEEDVPTQGGNIDKFREIVGEDDRKCEEYTMC